MPVRKVGCPILGARFLRGSCGCRGLTLSGAGGLSLGWRLGGWR